ncbi:MAG: tRNA/tmRNA/rRNA uracil-C5-methylase, TrmA/RlmC/RlmD family, partial [Arthrobacter sp.]|nr:tRNA/tmRNA/rRNA uracil-C5-methylase, TrmA/RlmC/RlmD family [Arthrobacter sp.]
MSPDTATQAPTDLVVDVGPVAHGGHCVARHEGRVVFVRHGIPGEKVRVRLTDAGPDAKFWRGDVVEVLEASPDRVDHFWDLADSARSWSHRHPPLGGAELGHISLERQRSLKAEVLAEQLQRLAGVDRVTEVEAVGEQAAQDGLAWRTRAGFAVTPGGKLGMHAHRSDTVLPVREMPLAVDGINALRLWEIDLQGIERVEV